MNIAFNIISGNLGIAFSTIVFMICIIGSIIFFALDFKQGLVIEIILMASLFMWFYSQHWNYIQPLATFLISIVLLSLSIFFIDKTSKGAYNI